MFFKFLSYLLYRSRSEKAFNKVLSTANKSEAFKQYCKEVHGEDFVQFNNLSAKQNQFIKETLQLKKGDHVLDIGAGLGHFASKLVHDYKVKVTAIDIADKAFKLKTLNFIKVDIQSKKDRNKLQDFRFNAIYAIDSLYGLKNHQNVLNDFLSLLRPGGKFIFTYTLFRVKDNYFKNSPIGMAIDHLPTDQFKLSVEDFTEDDINFWENAKTFLEHNTGSFRFGEDFSLWHIKNKETGQHLLAHKEKCIRRLIVIIEKLA